MFDNQGDVIFYLAKMSIISSFLDPNLSLLGLQLKNDGPFWLVFNLDLLSST